MSFWSILKPRLPQPAARRGTKHGRKAADRWLFIAAVGFVIGYHTTAHRSDVALCSTADLAAEPQAVLASAQQAGVDPELRRVFLTFDDGPSKNTPAVLRILAENQVTATFFVIAAENNIDYLPLVQQEVEQGCQVALHSCTHDYKQIYRSTDAYWEDIEELKRQLSAYIDVSGLNCLRFPGGSTNTVSRKYGGKTLMQELKQQAEERGYHWIDWNVCAEDAAGGKPSASEIYQNVIGGVKDQKNCVVLMHDTAATGTTVEALPEIIAWFKENGYTFCTVQELYR